MHYHYCKIDENFDKHNAPSNDMDGSITGKIVVNLKAYFDENPDEAHRLGYAKVIYHELKELVPDYDSQTQVCIEYYRQVDEWTYENQYEVYPKSEELMLLEEIGFGHETLHTGINFIMT